MSMPEHKRSSKGEIEDLIKARYSLIYLTSHEEARVEESLRKLCVEREMRLEVWSVTEGFKVIANGSGTRDVKDPMKALDHVLRAEGRALFVLRDFHPFLKEPAVVRRLRDAAHELRKTKKSLIMLSPVTKIPPELEKSIAAVVDWELPNRQEIEESARKILPAAPPATQQTIESDPTFMERVVESALGLTLVEAENVFAKSMVRTHTFDLETILEEKKQIIRKSGMLEYYEHREEFSDVGGMEILKDWLVKRRNAFSSRARDFGLPLPKGILLIGVPGTGKSLTAKAVGALWQMPLLRLDVGKIFAGLVGSSEENMRTVIKTAEAIAPAILDRKSTRLNSSHNPASRMPSSA
jgi:SpoVK/Ycf46/Vps4 family AAA+-type ATPase